MDVRSSIWPYDYFKTSTPPDRINPNHLVCFLICPLKPKDLYDALYNNISDVCSSIGKEFGCLIELKRADIISSAGIIHAEIWNEIQTADCIIADVSGFNGNVMIELGVAAACREKDQVIIIKNIDTEEFLFDIAPARHLLYNLSTIFNREEKFFKELSIAIVKALTPAPFRMDFNKTEMPDSLEVDFTKGHDVNWLISPSTMHRKLTDNYLEFGSLFSYGNSWLMVTGPEMPKVEVTAIMRFTKTRDPRGALIAVSVRKPHFFANFGHTLFLNSDGKNINRTVPENDSGKYHDDVIAPYPNFDLDKFYKFYIKIDDRFFSMFIDDIGKKYKISDIPFLFSGGKILLQTFRAFAGIKYLRIEKIK